MYFISARCQNISNLHLTGYTKTKQVIIYNDIVIT